jgi:hypothetical protein
MTSLRRALMLVLPTLACSTGGAPPPSDEEEVVDAMKAAPSGKPDASAPRPPKQDAASTALTPDAGAAGGEDAAPVTPPDASPGPEDAAALVDAEPMAGDGGLGASDAGGVPGAVWGYDACDKATLPFPKIDKNNGKFPPGSCPPPEALKAVCPGNSKLKFVGATASAYETGYVHPPAYAIDEHLMTRWSSPYGPDRTTPSASPAWIRLDFGMEVSWKRLYLLWEMAFGKDYDLVVSNDGQSWTPLVQVRGSDGFQDILEVSGKGRYLRMNGINRGPTPTGRLYGYSLFDVTACAE